VSAIKATRDYLTAASERLASLEDEARKLTRQIQRASVDAKDHLDEITALKASIDGAIASLDTAATRAKSRG
jgi:predicted  nucleic acid-binding Zn-ribbon protein